MYEVFCSLIIVVCGYAGGAGIACIYGKHQLCGAGSLLPPLTWVLVIELGVLRLLWLTC